MACCLASGHHKYQLGNLPHPGRSPRQTPLIAFHLVYLAQALEIGHTLCLSDELSPGICRHPNGSFCVLMPMRVAIPSAAETPEAETPTGVAQSDLRMFREQQLSHVTAAQWN